jgi:hypothetical protein
MNKFSKSSLWVACIGACLSWNAAAQTANGECEKAWARYNDFKKHNVMVDESQYAQTVYGAEVRAACGAEALPVPPGTDTPHYPIVRKPPKPVKPTEPPKPPKPPAAPKP